MTIPEKLTMLHTELTKLELKAIALKEEMRGVHFGIGLVTEMIGTAQDAILAIAKRVETVESIQMRDSGAKPAAEKTEQPKVGKPEKGDKKTTKASKVEEKKPVEKTGEETTVGAPIVSENADPKAQPSKSK